MHSLKVSSSKYLLIIVVVLAYVHKFLVISSSRKWSGLDLMTCLRRIVYGMEKIVTFQWRKLADTALTKAMEGDIIGDKSCVYYVSPNMM